MRNKDEGILSSGGSDRELRERFRMCVCVCVCVCVRLMLAMDDANTHTDRLRYTTAIPANLPSGLPYITERRGTNCHQETSRTGEIGFKTTKLIISVCFFPASSFIFLSL